MRDPTYPLRVIPRLIAAVIVLVTAAITFIKRKRKRKKHK
jgi:hypothetical protein